jgi:polar amino acid transport system substrate-binding protein
MICAMLASSALFIAGCGSDDDTFIVGITNYIPMNFKDADGNWTGFETEFAEKVGEMLGFKKVEFVEISWPALITEVNSGNVDAIWNGMSVMPERVERMDISIEYMKNRNIMVTRAENAEAFRTPEGLIGKRIVIEDGSAMLRMTTPGQAIFYEFFTDLQDYIEPVESQIVAFLEIRAGTADATIVDYVKGIGMLAEGGDYADLVIVDYIFPENNFAVGLKQGTNDDENAKVKLDDLNAAIQELKDSGWLLELARKYNLQDQLILN